MSVTPIFIGIAGASASGKSLLAGTIYQELKQELGDSALAIIKEDSYYREQGNLTIEERTEINYDHPNAFDHSLLCEHIEQLRQGKPVECPTYDYVHHNRADETVTIAATPVVIIEGILLYHMEALRELFSLKLFIDTPLDICLARRIERDVNERGRTVESVLSQYQKTVRPMYREFVEPSKFYADLIVPMGGRNPIALDVLDSKIRQLITA